MKASKKSAAPRVRKSRKVVQEDVKLAAANDTSLVVTEAPVVVPEAPKSEKAATVIAGQSWWKEAGKPSIPTQQRIFTKAGYGLSWQDRAKRLGISTEELVKRFVDNPDLIQKAWEALPKKERTIAS